MIKIGITGSLASGKTSACKILSHKKGPVFNADKVVEKLYNNKIFKQQLIKKFKIVNKNNLKKSIRDKISKNEKNIKILEKIIHPMVRKEMKKFSFINKNKKNLFYEIPLLIENKLLNYFDVIIFIKAKKKIRLKRFKAKGGSKNLFNLLNNNQLSDQKKAKLSDHVIVNEKNLHILKKNLISIMKLYE